MRNEISPFFLISRNSRNSAKQFLFRIIFVFRENKKIDEIDNPTTKAVVPGSIPASLTVEKLRGQAESLCMYTVKSRGRGGPPTVTKKKIEKKYFKKRIKCLIVCQILLKPMARDL